MRPGLIAAVIGVIAIVGATTLVGGIDDALHDPARVGTVWDLQVEPDDVVDLPAPLAMAPSPDIDGMGVVSRWPTVVGDIDAPVYAVFGGSGSAVRYVTLKGRGPLADDEVALGPRTASSNDSGIGDTVPVGPDHRPMRVVGIALFQQTPHSSFDEGAWVTPTAIDEMSGMTLNDRHGAVLIRLHPGADRDALLASFSESFFTEAPAEVPDVVNLANVRGLPLSLAAVPGTARGRSGRPRVVDRRATSCPRSGRAARPRHHAAASGGVRLVASDDHRHHRARHRRTRRGDHRPSGVAIDGRLVVVRLRRAARTACTLAGGAGHLPGVLAAGNLACPCRRSPSRRGGLRAE